MAHLTQKRKVTESGNWWKDIHGDRSMWQVKMVLYFSVQKVNIKIRMQRSQPWIKDGKKQGEARHSVC